MTYLKRICLLLLLCSPAAMRAADNARFDLAGPKIDVRVTRGSVTLPVAEVPNLQAGDKIWVKADLPSTQSNHLLLIVAFLRGTTNEPPDKWFTAIDTWNKKKTDEGTTITVPEGAEQAIMFVAPETGGDFKTLRSAVKGKPGLFIRADADLNEASFEQQRIERYLAGMKTVTSSDPKVIHDRSAKLAATLALKPNEDCFKQPVEQQVACLTQSSAPVLLSDGHGQSVAEALSSDASADFVNAAAVTPTAAGGMYSSYVGAVIDLVHLVAVLRTAQYQYIPAISFPMDATLHLKLNAPPSFVNPKTVIVIGLPAIQLAKLPPLKPHDANETACLLEPKMPLLLEGAPLVFSTSFAHDLVLHLNRTGAPTDLPLTPDALAGGLIVDKPGERKPLPEGQAGGGLPVPPTQPKPDVKIGRTTDLIITGSVHGYWGFDPFEGPTLNVQQIDGKNWKIVGDPQLMAGQDNKLTLKGDGTACVEHIALESNHVAPAGNKNKDVDVAFKPAPSDGGSTANDTLALEVSLKTVQPGGYALAIEQYGDKARSKVALTAYNGAIRFDDVKIHAGDRTTELTGTGLGDVVSVEIAGQAFTPVDKAGQSDGHTLKLEARTGVTPENGAKATVKLKDGRTLAVNVSTQAARPSLKLLSFKATPAQSAGDLAIALGAKDDIPLHGTLSFVVQTREVFPRTQTVEVATADGAVRTSLSIAANTLVLQDEHTAIAKLNPLQAFGASAFGKLAMRPVAADGTPGDWTPLGTLVRTPNITAVHCTTAAAPTCTADGNDFFLVQAFSAAKDFARPAEVPTGAEDTTFPVPTPADGTTLYMKLRDDPAATATLTLPAPVPAAAPAAAEPAAATPADAAQAGTATAPATAAATNAGASPQASPAKQVPATPAGTTTQPPAQPADTPRTAPQPG